ncbi:MAG TPA: trypsin-like peptidase domain-containing protein [Gaiellaceae bacterium]|nr:trypsin-like peptidase domain-containing protein [Gaiellaceae bacterium]
MRRRIVPLALAATVLLAAAVAYSGTRGGASAARPNAPAAAASVPVVPAAQALSQQFQRVVRAVEPSVVQIETSEGLGSGVVFDRAGHIVTNAHVIGNAKTFTVTLYNGSRIRGTLVASFPPEDIGVIDIDVQNLRPIAWARSAAVGEIVMAIGNPLGLRASVTQGIVSAVGRLGEEGGGIVLPDTVQTSAAINPGNSGGALVNLRGEMVGIPTLGAVNPAAGTVASGISFAISSRRALFIARQIVASGRVSSTGRAFLGVRVGQALGAPGVVIADVISGSPAAKAGLQVGQAIVSIAGQRTPDPQALASVLATKRPGQTVAVSVASPEDGRRTVRVTLAQLPGG